jgi:hypothetical protein
LFRELSAAAEHVTWSWSRSNADGKASRPSAFLASKLSDGSLVVDKFPEFAHHGAHELAPLKARALEHALLGDRLGTEAWLGTILDPLCADLTSDLIVQDAGRTLARSRFEALNALEPLASSTDSAEPWPYLGLTYQGEDDRQLYVTSIENVFRCPWQTFLRKILRLEPLPDPLEGAPGIHPLTLGRVIHEVLEKLVPRSQAKSLADSVRNGPTTVARPSPERVKQLAESAAHAIGQEDGLHLPGLRRALAAQAERYVDRAVAFLWDDPRQVVESFGAELEGSVHGTDLSGKAGILRFRADYADRMPSGLTRIIDWKSSKGPGSKSLTATRLQGTAYAHAEGLTGSALGIYGYLKPSSDPVIPTLPVSSDDNDPALLLHFAIRNGLSLWRLGLWFPLLSTPDGRSPDACRQCDVREACHQGDSGSKRRFEQLVQAYSGENPNTSPLHTLLTPIFLAQNPKSLKSLLVFGDGAPKGDES